MTIKSGSAKYALAVKGQLYLNLSYVNSSFFQWVHNVVAQCLLTNGV